MVFRASIMALSLMCVGLVAGAVRGLSLSQNQESPFHANVSVTMSSMEYSINMTWDGQPLEEGQLPTNLTLTADLESRHLNLTISAPFYNDSLKPEGPPGQAFYGLWDYEVVEVFFLNDENQYIEIEVCPWGQHIVLLLNGQRNTIRHSLPLQVETIRLNNTWTGTARIPFDYLPTNVTMFNAYAIHGSDQNRTYEALYPADFNTTLDPDFHDLQYFEEIDLSILIPDYDTEIQSKLWTNALQGRSWYSIQNTWNGDSVSNSHSPVEVTLEGSKVSEMVVVNVAAPFFNDSVPANPEELSTHEVVELFFLNKEDEYLQVQLGPHGQYQVLLLKGADNVIQSGISLDYTAQIFNKTTGAEWKGVAEIPNSYFPALVTSHNMDSMNGQDTKRNYETLYPASKNKSVYPSPNFHRLELFRAIDFEFLVPNNTNYSDVWQNALKGGGGGGGGGGAAARTGTLGLLSLGVLSVAVGLQWCLW